MDRFNAPVYDANGRLLGCGLTLDEGVVDAIGRGSDEEAAAADTAVFPGFVDIHCHGAAGYSFPNDLDPWAIRAAAARHAQDGTLTLIASLVSAADPVPALRALAAACEEGTLAGIHIEGPYISEHKCGAQDPAVIRPIDLAELARYLAAGGGWVRSMTIAPELAQADAAAELLLRAGARPSWGHTSASGEQARERLAQTVTIAAGLGLVHPVQTVTHLFNAMPPLHHRAPGPVLEFLAAAGCSEAVVEVIGDGVHLDLRLVEQLLCGFDGSVALITDAMAAAGMPDGSYQLGTLAVTVQGGTATLTGTDTIAGGTSTLGEQVRMLLARGVRAPQLARAACGTPACALGLAEPVAAQVGEPFSGVLVGPDGIRTWRHGVELRGDAV